MGKNTKIQWATSSWNPWMGCTKVSEGCKNCYMFRDQKRFGNDPTVIRKSKTRFNAPLSWQKPMKIFVCSWSDFFHEDVPAEWREEAWNIMLKAKQHTYLILTKRAENFSKFMPVWWGDYPWEHIWLGISAENQERADERIPQLLSIPAVVRFVSAEPLLGPINFRQDWQDYFAGWTTESEYDSRYDASSPIQVQTERIDWVITGGESDFKEPRLCDLDWIRSIRDECKSAGVKFFHKQHGGSKKINGAWGGRELDGRTWDEFPE